jgi:hypothetical protein
VSEVGSFSEEGTSRQRVYLTSNKGKEKESKKPSKEEKNLANAALSALKRLREDKYWTKFTDVEVSSINWIVETNKMLEDREFIKTVQEILLHLPYN